ncbi:MAG TPA: ATP synthase subunit C [Bacillota bacterium]|nr:ATP synthase subunit C [Bacillota bacterium]HPF42209.1 ATP synthase subunit C [Bacillota bacterium]HPQ61764.1 ATP synthase subunit C [Bacillota bacterium]HRX91250.1 ATP synthase subunit C [Candidatus Izemoplasmatales bacterium]
MLNGFEWLLPLALLILISLPLVNVFRGKVSFISAKRRVLGQVFGFFGLLILTAVFEIKGVWVAAAGETTAFDGSIAQGLGFLSAALAAGLSSLGAGIAVAAGTPAAIGALSENEKTFGKSMIFVALGEGIAIYGLLISILIINKL